IRPWLVRWEQHISWKCLDEGERKRLFAEYMLDALVRADMETRNAALSTQRMNGAINANEWRALINMNPIEGRAGEIYWQPLNMTDADEPDTIMGSQEPAEPEPEEDSIREQRVLRTIRSRRLAARSYRPLFLNATKTILKTEVKNIRKIAKASFAQRDVGDFVFEINEFYKTFRKMIFKEFSAVYQQFGIAIYPLATDEINADPEPSPEFTAYTVEFADKTTNRYIGSSAGQLTEVAREAEDPIVAVEERLVQWEERRPDKVADREIIDGENGFAQFVYFTFGFVTVWVTLGKNCPYCDALDGRVISRGQNYLAGGSSFQPAGVDTPMFITNNISHPAAHQGCDCSIRAGVL
ncbi:hypothetical protein LCGC14_2584390, partial [marine sediment metagenome]